MNQVSYKSWTLQRWDRCIRKFLDKFSKRLCKVELSLFQNTCCESLLIILCRVLLSLIQKCAAFITWLKHLFGCVDIWRWAALAHILICFLGIFSMIFLITLDTSVAKNVLIDTSSFRNPFFLNFHHLSQRQIEDMQKCRSSFPKSHLVPSSLLAADQWFVYAPSLSLQLAYSSGMSSASHKGKHTHVNPTCSHLQCNAFATIHRLDKSKLIFWSSYSRLKRHCFVYCSKRT